MTTATRNPKEEAQPVTAIGYDAKGEAVDMPVDMRPAPSLPGMEPEEDADAEFFEGKRILGWKWSFTGNQLVSRTNAALSAKRELLQDGKPVLLLVEIEPGSVTFEESTEDGYVKGVFHRRKCHVTEVFAADDADTEALFEQGLVRVKRAKQPDDVGYLTAEAPIPDDENPLAASLAEAMPVEPGMCGQVHEGHLNLCRQPSHSCPLRAA